MRRFSRIFTMPIITFCISYSGTVNNEIGDYGKEDDSIDCKNDPNIVFCADFENTGSWRNDWDDGDQNVEAEVSVVNDTGPFGKGGNHTLRFNIPLDSNGSDLVKYLSSSYDELYMRYFFLWEDGWDFSKQNHGMGMSAMNYDIICLGCGAGERANGNDKASISLEPFRHEGDYFARLKTYSYYRGMYQACWDSYCYGDHFPCMMSNSYCEKEMHKPPPMSSAMETGKWYCIEQYMNMGASVIDDGNDSNDEYNEVLLAYGVQSFFIDSEEIGPWKNLWLRTTSDLKINTIWLKIYLHDGYYADVGQRFDELVLSTERIGCGPISD